jgi:hypothetical protein
MKFGKILILGLAVVSGLAVSTQVSASKVQAYNNSKSSQYMKPIKQYKFVEDNYDEYIYDLQSIREYQKAAINYGDAKTFIAGNKAWRYVVCDYAKDMYSTKFDVPAQRYLVNYRFAFQRDTNLQFKEIKLWKFQN